MKQYYLSYRACRMQHFTIFQDKLHSVNIQDNQSWAFSETVQKIYKITYTASQFSLFTGAKFAVRVVVELDLPTSRAEICSRARSPSGKFFMFSAAKASERARAKLVSPAKNRTKWRHFAASYLRPCRVCCREPVPSRAVKVCQNKQITEKNSDKRK